jgi:hypothetical protein
MATFALSPSPPHVCFGSWSCENALDGVRSGLVRTGSLRSGCLIIRPGATGRRGQRQVAIAAIIGLMPTMFMVRVRL